ncbi:MAG: NADH-quinone oxidoreductase subunit L [candidate division Zixibacteria bacterium]|nr:NADH-quinone oxidoreductase subunit L [candidate division Zixibacteria bacterium]
MLSYSWLIPFFPILAFVLIIFFTIKKPKLSSLVSIGAVSLSFVFSLIVLITVLSNPVTSEFKINWLDLPGFKVEAGMLIDPLTAIMLMVVTIVSMLVQIYSVGYMAGDPRFSRYFSFLSLFTFSMLGLVLSNNFFEIFIFWELVGLTSYLLIGFWFEKKSASDAGKKAFITTRTGDLAFLVGIFLLTTTVGTLNFQEAFHQVESGAISATLLTLSAILIFGGAVGKSAQFPLHVWLPDAMEGPTPVSALIHAATMVAAGVYLVARLMTIYALSVPASLVVAIIGAFTAFLAASIGLVQNDIKRVLAYSTISQLGYMIMALGLGGYTAGTFHLMTHASFKALLFLGAGSVIHAMHTNDIWEMGGLYPKMKTTAITFIIGSLSLAGIFPLSGFWSKDEILLLALNKYPIFMLVGLAVAFMTAFYMFRLCFVTFYGKPRDHHKFEHAHESPKVMTVPLVILAFLSIFAGWVGIPWLHKGYSSFVYHHEVHHLEPNFILMIVATLVALSGIYLAYLMYYKGSISPEKLKNKFSFIYKVLYNKYYFDELYNAIIIKPLFKLTDFLYKKFDLGVIDWLVNSVGNFTVFLSWLWELFDTYIVDGAVNGLGYVVRGTGAGMRKVQTGQLQNYAFIIFFGIVLIILLKLF